MPEIISRKEAKERGLKRYFTGEPCRNGHYAERLASGHCVKCTSEGFARWAERNPEKRKSQRRGKNRNKKARERYRRDSEYRRKTLESTKRYVTGNKEKRAEYARNYHLNGPSNPTGEKQWLSKAKVSVRNLRRLLRKPNLDHSHWLSEGLKP